MFNPFYPLTSDLLQAFVQKGKLFFVRQSMPRAKKLLDEGVKGYFLFTPYDNFTTAQDHFGAIGHDSQRFLYKWQEPLHREKLEVAASGLSDYRIYAAVCVPGWEKGITDLLREKIRRYVSRLGWTPKGSDTVETAYEIRFGELYLCLKYKKREAKVKFEEIETLP